MQNTHDLLVGTLSIGIPSYTNYSFGYLLTFIMVGHLFQNYDTIFVRFFPTYTCNHSCKKTHVYRVARILAFFPALWGFYFQVYDHFLTNAHIYAHKKSAYICVTNKHVYTPISIKVASEKNDAWSMSHSLRGIIVVSLVNYVPATSLET